MDTAPDPKKSLGQHWLDDKAALTAIADSARLNDTDTVLEIGPGPGSLTELLVQRAGQVVAVELDQKLAGGLAKQIQTDNLTVIQGDILQFDFSTLPSGYKLVANIPYYLTGKLLRILSETTNPPAVGVLLLQKEVARRVTAGPGDMSILSVTTQFYWQANLGDMVPAKLFTPPPKIDSQILILEHRQLPLFPDVELKQFFRLVKAGFAQPRKTLLNNLSSGLQLSREAIQNICQIAGINSSRRPQTLSLDDWHRLYQSANT